MSLLSTMEIVVQINIFAGPKCTFPSRLTEEMDKIAKASKQRDEATKQRAINSAESNMPFLQISIIFAGISNLRIFLTLALSKAQSGISNAKHDYACLWEGNRCCPEQIDPQCVCCLAVYPNLNRQLVLLRQPQCCVLIAHNVRCQANARSPFV